MMLATAPVVAEVPVEEFRKGLSDIGERLKSLDTLSTELKTTRQENEKLRKEFDEAKNQIDQVRRNSLKLVTASRQRAGEISDDCARTIGAVFVLQAEKAGKLQGIDSSVREKLVGDARAVFGMEAKATLTSSDIPLPVEYGAEVTELVVMYGQARKHGTTYPLGGSSVKLPRLKTSPAFGFIAQAASVPEKSPQIEWVTFTPSKLGGLIRIPSELDADSLVPLGRFIARYAARETAKMEDLTFFIGDGTATYDSKTGLTKYVVDQTKLVTLAATKTRISDVTLANVRALRAVPSTAVLGVAKYYFHPTMEQHFAGFNTAGDKPYIANGINGASLDGFKIEWVDALPPYSTAVDASKVFGLFGDISYSFLGTRGGYRFDTSTDVYFATDEIAIRALERIDVQHMATDHVAGIRTAAS